LSLGGNTDRWDAGLNARHRIRDSLDLTASLTAGAEWGQDTEWQGLVGMKLRW